METPKNKKKGHTLGNPDISKSVLHRLAERHPIAKTILDYRHYNTLNSMFLHKYATCHSDGRIYCSYHSVSKFFSQAVDMFVDLLIPLERLTLGSGNIL